MKGSTWWRCTRCKVKVYAPRKGISGRVCSCGAQGFFVLLERAATPSRQLSLLEQARKAGR